MKKILISIFCVLLSTFAFAQKTKTKSNSNHIEKENFEFSPKKVIEKYWDALGGKEKLDSIQSTITETDYNVQGVEFSEVTKRMGPKMISTRKMHDVISVQKFNGEKGILEQNNEKTPLNLEQITKLKKDKMVQALDLNPNNYKNVIKEKFDGKDYVVLVSTNKKEYFDLNSGLLTLIKEPTAETHIKDYLSVKGVKFPSVISIKEKDKNTNLKVKKITINPKLSESEFKF